MDFGLASLRSLIEDFLSDSGGRRGREREQQRQQRDDGTDDAGGATAQSGGESDVESTDGEEPTESDTDERAVADCSVAERARAATKTISTTSSTGLRNSRRNSRARSRRWARCRTPSSRSRTRSRR